MLARHDSTRSPASGTRHTPECAPRARRPPSTASRATSPGVVAAARAELRCCRCWLRSRLANSVRVRRARSTAWAAAPVMVKRKLLSASEMDRRRAQWTTTAPTARSETTSGTMASEVNRFESADTASGDHSASRRLERLGEESLAVRHDSGQLAVGRQGGQQGTLGLAGLVPEAAMHAEHAPIVRGEGRRVHAQLLTQGAEDRVGHLGWIGRRGQCPGQRLHALRGLRRHPSPALYPGLGSGRAQLLVPLRAQVGDPDGDARTDHQGHHAEEMVQVAVLAGRRVEHDREEGGVQSDQRRTSGAGEGGGDEGADGQEPDQPQLAVVERVEEGHDRDPEDRDRDGQRPRCDPPGRVRIRSACRRALVSATPFSPRRTGRGHRPFRLQRYCVVWPPASCGPMPAPCPAPGVVGSPPPREREQTRQVYISSEWQ